MHFSCIFLYRLNNYWCYIIKPQPLSIIFLERAIVGGGGGLSRGGHMSRGGGWQMS